MSLESSNHFDSCESLAGQPRQIISELTEQSKRIMDYGRSQFYTDQIIVTFLMVKGIFNLTMRATQGLYDSLLELMNVPLFTTGIAMSAG